MISPQEEEYIFDKAYVPEHSVGLMALISRAEPFLIEEYLCFVKGSWTILVGYPLDGHFAIEEFERVVGNTMKRFKPEYLWFVAPEVPSSMVQYCQERESDYYYKIAVQDSERQKNLRRVLKRASRDLTVERGKEILKVHHELISEFLERANPNPRVRELFLSMPRYVTESETAVVLNARYKRDKGRSLSGFYVVELGAKHFATYVVGCHSKKHYVCGASDLLFFEMINLAREHGKSYIHLGLGVREGIRRFKEKWGGIPFLRYEFCEYIRDRSLMPLRLTSKL